jgi:glutathione transport system ATP-binding protein
MSDRQTLPPLAPEQVLAVRDLNVRFQHETTVTDAVRNLSLDLFRGETLALVGESGSGKSVTSLALMRLIEQAGGRVSGEVMLRRRNGDVLDLMRASKGQMRRVRGADMAMIFQEPMTSLNPVFSVGEQIAESIRLHQGLSHAGALAEARRMLDLVRIPDAQKVLSRFPHQLSGGMRQRVMIAMALACNPKLLIADEPTTALDVTIQAQILDLMRDLKRRIGAAIVLITHDLGVVAEVAERVMVMYAGRKVEEAPVRELFRTPRHPYTQGLLGAVPKLGSSLTGVETRLAEIPGLVPSLKERIPGCVFASRCPYATELCREFAPALEAKAPGHVAACHYAAKEALAA